MNRKPNLNSLKNLRPPWRPGESGNPAGVNRRRPYADRLFEKAEEQLPEELRTKFNAAFEKQFGKADMLPPTATYADAEILRIHLDVILKGSIPSAEFIADRVEGRPPSRLDLLGHTRQEVTFRVVTENRAPRPERIESVLFQNVVELIKSSNSSGNEDEEFLTKAAEFGAMLRERAKRKGKVLDVQAAR